MPLLREQVARVGDLRVMLMDSISQVEPADEGQVVVSGSHGGVSSGEYALRVPLAAAFFNDAGVGKEGAGTAALAMLEEVGVPAGTYAHDTARIGDARDAWTGGVVSHLNGPARAAGLRPGLSIREAVEAFIEPRPQPGAGRAVSRARVAGSAEAVEHDWGSIEWLVSGQLVPGAEITFGCCEIAPGHGNPRHLHPNCDEVLYVLRGVLDHEVEGEVVRLTPGSALHIPRDSAHQAQNPGPELARVLVAYSTGDRRMVPAGAGGADRRG